MSEVDEEASAFMMNKESYRKRSMRAIITHVLVCLAEALSKHESSGKARFAGFGQAKS